VDPVPGSARLVYTRPKPVACFGKFTSGRTNVNVSRRIWLHGVSTEYSLPTKKHISLLAVSVNSILGSNFIEGVYHTKPVRVYVCVFFSVAHRTQCPTLIETKASLRYNGSDRTRPWSLLLYLWITWLKGNLAGNKREKISRVISTWFIPFVWYIPPVVGVIESTQSE
jgi:hypothetical protein